MSKYNHGLRTLRLAVQYRESRMTANESCPIVVRSIEPPAESIDAPVSGVSVA